MKKNNTARLITILVVLVLAIVSIIPSIQVHSRTGDAKTQYLKEHPKLKAINFGLDLAGGTNIVVEIDKSGLKADEAADAQERSLEIIRNRVDQFGLSEPLITPSGDNRIVADLAGVDVESARNLIGETALLEFKLVATQEQFVRYLGVVDGYLSRNPALLRLVETGDSAAASAMDTATQVDTTTVVTSGSAIDSLLAAAEKDSVAATDSMAKVASADTTASQDSLSDSSKVAGDTESLKSKPFSSLLRRSETSGDIGILETELPKAKRILALPGLASLLPREFTLQWGRGFETLKNGDKLKKAFLLKTRAEMDGKEIETAKEERTSGGLQAGEIVVSMKFKGHGPRQFARVTAANVGRQMAIVLDDQVISAPVIRDKIPDGRAQISGNFDMAEAKQLAVILRAGALPAPMKVVELRNVGATLGQDNIHNGLFAMVVGLALVVAFMVFYYHGMGLVANVALVLNMLLIGALMSMFQATLTLPGIAGIVLTMGMAVDANVLINERIREELRHGKSARQAVSAGYERAFKTIFDANITTILTAVILYYIGSGPIKGFGLTLILGIISSMFTALTVTRHIVDWYLSRSDSPKLSIGRGFHFLDHPNLPVMAKRRIFVTISIVLVSLSVLLIAFKGLNVGIDYTGGHVFTVQYDNQSVTIEQVREAMEKGGLGEATVRELGGTDANQFLVSIAQDADGTTVVRDAMDKAIASGPATGQVVNEDMVGPSVGKELRNDAILSAILAWIMIILYIWVRFGRYGLGFGVGGVLALVHDSLITIGVFSLLGLPVDAPFIAAILTIIGYSINDTIVIFDRIRENTQIMGKDSYIERVNQSVNQTFGRSIVTAGTVFLVVLVLALRGGSSIQGFAIAMCIGSIVGTYSSVFIASPFVVWWANRFGSLGKSKAQAS